MTNILTKAKKRALEHVLDTLSRKDTATDLAPDFTCKEAETIHDLLLEFGRADEARRWLNAHAIADRHPTSLHYKRGEKLRKEAVK